MEAGIVSLLLTLGSCLQWKFLWRYEAETKG